MIFIELVVSIHIDAFFIINNFSIFFMFEKKIFIGPPDAPTRTALLKKFLSVCFF